MFARFLQCARNCRLGGQLPHRSITSSQLAEKIAQPIGGRMMGAGRLHLARGAVCLCVECQVQCNAAQPLSLTGEWRQANWRRRWRKFKIVTRCACHSLLQVKVVRQAAPLRFGCPRFGHFHLLLSATWRRNVEEPANPLLCWLCLRWACAGRLNSVRKQNFQEQEPDNRVGAISSFSEGDRFSYVAVGGGTSAESTCGANLDRHGNCATGRRRRLVWRRKPGASRRRVALA